MSASAQQPVTAPTSKFLAIPWKRTSWTKENKTVAIKHWLDATEQESKQVECKYYTLAGKEAKELYILWRKEFEIKIELHFPTEEARMKVVKKLIEDDAKRVFEWKIGEINDDNRWLRSGRDNDTYIVFKESDIHKKAKHVAALDKIQDHVFGRGRNGKYPFVYQKRYMRR